MPLHFDDSTVDASEQQAIPKKGLAFGLSFGEMPRGCRQLPMAQQSISQIGIPSLAQGNKVVTLAPKRVADLICPRLERRFFRKHQFLRNSDDLEYGLNHFLGAKLIDDRVHYGVDPPEEIDNEFDYVPSALADFTWTVR
jgi:hypothetical protein